MALQEKLIRRGNVEPQMKGSAGIGNIRPLNFNIEYLSALTEEFAQCDRFREVDCGILKLPDKKTLTDYISSAAFRESVIFAGNRLDRFATRSEYESWLAGFTFENLAWHAVSLSTTGVLLPQDYVVDLLKEVGQVKLCTNQDGRDGALGIYVPDAVLVENKEGVPKITRFYEFTSVDTDFNKFQRQSHGARMLKRDLAPILADDVRLIFVMPVSRNENIDSFKDTIRASSKSLNGDSIDIVIQQLPVTRAQLADLTTRIIGFSANDNSATLLQQIREREFLLAGTQLGKRAKKVELGRQILSGFNGVYSQDTRDYVARWISDYDEPIRGSKIATKINLPRISPQSMGEPSVGLWGKLLSSYLSSSKPSLAGRKLRESF